MWFDAIPAGSGHNDPTITIQPKVHMPLPGFTHTFGFSWNDGTESLVGNTSLTHDTEDAVDVTVAANATRFVAMAFPLMSLMSMFIVATQAATLTFTLSTGTKVITLIAGVPYVWINGRDPAWAQHDIDSLSITAGGASTDIHIRILLDSQFAGGS